MAAKFGGNEDEPITDINITPLVDIILVVLIIFMVTATYIVEAIPVTLPQASQGESVERTSLGLQLTSDGKLYLDGEEIDEAGLRAHIRSEKTKVEKPEEDITALIAADSEVNHGRVVWLIDLVKQEGIVKFAINIDPATVESGKEAEG